MFGYRTPVKPIDAAKPQTNVEAVATSVRRSIGEWEAANADPTPPMQSAKAQVSPQRARVPKAKAASRRASVETHSSPVKYDDRVSEAKACLQKAKLNLNASRNLRTDIKTAIVEALDRLYKLVKESESDRAGNRCAARAEPEATGGSESATVATVVASPDPELSLRLQEHSRKLADNTRIMQELKDTLDQHKVTVVQPQSYASVAADGIKNPTPLRTTLHSVVISSTDEMETGEEVLSKVRKAADAKEGWVKIERVRKGKGSKIIMGFGTVEDRNRMKEKLEKGKVDLTVEEVKNKDPLLILKSVLSINTDEDVLQALRNQNRDVFRGLDGEENRIEVRYRRRTRNPHAQHVVLSASPTIWHRVTQAGHVHIDLQRVRAEDQSPLVQCTRCLGFGHGRKLCQEPDSLCSHCGGPHLKAECSEWLAAAPPACRNCAKAKLDEGNHNAFSSDCPVRRRWDEIARTTVAYC